MAGGAIDEALECGHAPGTDVTHRHLLGIPTDAVVLGLSGS